MRTRNSYPHGGTKLVLRTAMTAAIALAGARAVAHAGEVPAGAYESATGIPGILQNHFALMLELPQCALAHAPTAFGLGNASSNGVPEGSPASGSAVGVLLGGTAARVFLTSQPVPDTPGISWSSDLGRFVQAGAARRVGPLRLGTSFGAAHASSSTQEDSGSGTFKVNSESRRVEATLGAGLDPAGGTLDLALGLRWERYDAGQSSSFSGSRRSSRVEGNPLYWITARGEMGSVDGTRLTAAATYRDAGVERTASFLGSQGEGNGEASDAGSSLRVALAGTRRVESVGDVTLWSSWTSARWSATAFPTQPSNVSSETRRTWTTEAGVAVRRPLWRDTTALIGLQADYQRFKNTGRDTAPSYSRDWTTERDDFGDRFSWGLSHTHGRVTLVGAMNTHLSFDTLFASLDVQVAL